MPCLRGHVYCQQPSRSARAVARGQNIGLRPTAKRTASSPKETVILAWSAADISIEIDPRSRYFDHYDPDRTPMPQDDPAAHGYMRCVDGKNGWKHWYDNGVRSDLENPAWREELVQYAETTDDGAVRLNVDSAVRLSYVHSPSHQSQLETLYLSAVRRDQRTLASGHTVYRWI